MKPFNNLCNIDNQKKKNSILFIKLQLKKNIYEMLIYINQYPNYYLLLNWRWDRPIRWYWKDLSIGINVTFLSLIMFVRTFKTLKVLSWKMTILSYATLELNERFVSVKCTYLFIPNHIQSFLLGVCSYWDLIHPKNIIVS